MLGKKVTTIGRTDDNDLAIDTKFISRHHAQMLAGPNFTVLEDLGSTNGVYVNNRRISKQTLKDGDQVTHRQDALPLRHQEHAAALTGRR